MKLSASIRAGRTGLPNNIYGKLIPMTIPRHYGKTEATMQALAALDKKYEPAKIIRDKKQHKLKGLRP